jgi:hypothetical protein
MTLCLNRAYTQTVITVIMTTAPYIQSEAIIHNKHFLGNTILHFYIFPFCDGLCTVRVQQKNLAGLAGLAVCVKLSRLRLRTESLVAKPVAESNTSSNAFFSRL